jgi:hypothetical protein
MMRGISIICATLLAFTTVLLAQQPTPSADDIARRAFDNLGGDAAWQKARYFAFTFNVERDGKLAASLPQRWDRYTGQYRVSGKKPDDTPFEVTLNVNTKTGYGTLKGAAVTDPAQLKELIDLGYRRFINDTYWLLMPLKMLDPGVHRTYDGERTDSCGHTWDLIKLSFDSGVGLTPGDVYWPWINRDTGLVEQWDMKLQTMRPEEPPLQVLFHDYRRISGLLISLRREVRGKNQIVRLDDLKILPDLPKDAFQ